MLLMLRQYLYITDIHVNLDIFMLNMHITLFSYMDIYCISINCGQFYSINMYMYPVVPKYGMVHSFIIELIIYTMYYLRKMSAYYLRLQVTLQSEAAAKVSRYNHGNM